MTCMRFEKVETRKQDDQLEKGLHHNNYGDRCDTPYEADKKKINP